MTFRRSGTGPMLSRHDIPDIPPDIQDPTSVFNPGAVLVGETTILMLRVQTRGRRTYTVPAVGRDRKPFLIADRPVEFRGMTDPWRPLGGPALRVHHVYDARITPLEGDLLVTTAVDTDQGCRVAIWRAVGRPDGPFAGLERLDLVGMSGQPDTRNGVLFPERIGGRYHLLERPNRPQGPGRPASGDRIVLSTSADLITWDAGGPVMSGRPHFWDELIGSGPPPVRTNAGWLHVYHGVATHFRSVNIYQVGAVLLDAADPRKVLGRTPQNLLEPREPWELAGQVPNVVFPSGMTLVQDRLHLYYGAADTVVGHAVADLQKVIAACVFDADGDPDDGHDP